MKLNRIVAHEKVRKSPKNGREFGAERHPLSFCEKEPRRDREFFYGRGQRGQRDRFSAQYPLASSDHRMITGRACLPSAPAGGHGGLRCPIRPLNGDSSGETALLPGGLK